MITYRWHPAEKSLEFPNGGEVIIGEKLAVDRIDGEVPSDVSCGRDEVKMKGRNNSVKPLR